VKLAVFQDIIATIRRNSRRGLSPFTFLVELTAVASDAVISPASFLAVGHNLLTRADIVASMSR